MGVTSAAVDVVVAVKMLGQKSALRQASRVWAKAKRHGLWGPTYHTRLRKIRAHEKKAAGLPQDIHHDGIHGRDMIDPGDEARVGDAILERHHFLD